MRTTALFTIDGQAMIVPDGDLSMEEADLISSDSGCDESGVYHQFGLGKRVKCWDFSYSRLNRTELAYMENLFAEKDTFRFGFVSMTDGERREVTAYRSKRSILWHNAADDQFRDYRFWITEC